ncbi:MAG: ATP-binding cassette domain-containing protein [Saprospiraceae bacterium]|nr:ATP-binding cassette domain-containing protein [Saprospiraceae bacterium]
MIRLHEISKAYGNHQVLDGINLDLSPGHVYGIVGENGAGKTTLFRCIAGLEPCQGTIQAPTQPLKDHTGFLPTNPEYLSRITGWEYLKLMSIARDLREDDFAAQNVFDLPLDQYAQTYSTGMKKKLALMGILLQKNDLFILDEPFNGVDIHSNMIIQDLIRKLRSLKKIILISSHIFATLQESCDSIHLLQAGKIAKSVLPEDFGVLEEQMKTFVVGDRINRIRLG